MSQLYILSAPSGAGKSSLIAELLKFDPTLKLSISHTTRAPRDGEVEGQHYYFIDQDRFLKMQQENAFLEDAKVFDYYYGTTKKSVRKQLNDGYDCILEIDWQGAKQVREIFPNVKTIFILPPTLEALETRLKSRGQDSDQVIARRMQDAKNEISHYPEFDYIVINEDFNRALTELQHIFSAQRLKCQHQTIQHTDLLRQLLA